QEALKRGFERLRAGQKITVDDPAGYFFGIARNLLRESGRSRKLEELEERHLARSHLLFHGLDADEQRILLRECLKKLPQEDLGRRLGYVEGRTEAWGKKIGISLGAVRMRIHRIRRRLEALVKPYKEMTDVYRQK